ncbi:hypothetical protein KY290_012254 [Solanum tuberosum]|uniref:Retrotransposon gag domain-containing protein n=1 Tax=Solanum tuberosum TaxID=4113 RepID=A0ABQ7W2Y9_SOLTU|nr:hypothetical protein KY290_012254 [Solanum tuberosum]
MNTVVEELFGGIVYATNAHKVWEDLKEHFDKVNQVRIYQLHREITTLAQGTDSVSTYFSKLKNLWSEYDVVMPSPSCECVRSKDYIDHLYQLRLIQFLSSLNDSYDQARRQILLKSITPSINQAYAMVIENEIQHSACLITATENSAPVAMQSSRNQTYNQGNQPFRGKKLQCDYCHFTGQTRDNYYKLNGYPSDWKHKKRNEFGNGGASGARGVRTQNYGNNGGHTAHNGPQYDNNGSHTSYNGTQSFSYANNISGKLDDPGQVASSSHAVNNAFVAKKSWVY